MAQLDSRGHASVSVDLPIADPSLGMVDYAAMAAEAFGEHENLIVVGHSLGGFVIPFITELIPVRTLVFQAGAIQPGAFPGLPSAEEMLLIPADAMSPDPDGLIRLSDSTAERYFYHDLSKRVRGWATSQFRPQSVLGSAPERQPDVGQAIAFASIICTDDQAIAPRWSQAAARDALHIEPYVLPGRHSPFLSRPSELADILGVIGRSTERPETETPRGPAVIVRLIERRSSPRNRHDCQPKGTPCPARATRQSACRYSSRRSISVGWRRAIGW